MWNNPKSIVIFRLWTEIEVKLKERMETFYLDKGAGIVPTETVIFGEFTYWTFQEIPVLA